MVMCLLSLSQSHRTAITHYAKDATVDTSPQVSSLHPFIVMHSAFYSTLCAVGAEGAASKQLLILMHSLHILFDNSIPNKYPWCAMHVISPNSYSIEQHCLDNVMSIWLANFKLEVISLKRAYNSTFVFCVTVGVLLVFTSFSMLYHFLERYVVWCDYVDCNDSNCLIFLLFICPLVWIWSHQKSVNNNEWDEQHPKNRICFEKNSL